MSRWKLRKHIQFKKVHEERASPDVHVLKNFERIAVGLNAADANGDEEDEQEIQQVTTKDVKKFIAGLFYVLYSWMAIFYVRR